VTGGGSGPHGPRGAPPETLMAPCGISCAGCPVRWAGTASDRVRRASLAAAVAEAAREEHGMDLSPEDVACGGCGSEDGKLLASCLRCGIRSCVRERGFDDCSCCDEFPCGRLRAVFLVDPAAGHRLGVLRRARLRE